MDVKKAFLYGKLDDEVYMNQPHSFIMPGNKNKVCKLIKFLYGLKKAHKQWHQKFDEVVLSGGYLLYQADKCVYNKFDESGKGDIICLYVDGMLIFGTDKVQVELTKEFLSSRFSIKDIGVADVIIDIGLNMKASKKQTCITSLTMESKFMALASADKEAEWHNMIRELIMNGVVSIEFVRSQQNLADHLMKRLDRDLVIKSAKGMGIKFEDVQDVQVLKLKTTLVEDQATIDHLGISVCFVIIKKEEDCWEIY
ncbi:zinc finger, CCHC-type containing protein [Tanacetum coccineum]